MYRIMVWSQDGKWEQIFADSDFHVVCERFIRYKVRKGFTKHLFHELDKSTMQE
jgi:hypothetical protein